MNNFQISKNFNLREFESPDTGEVKISSELVEKLQKLRDRINVPIYVNSGYRTHERNRSVNGHPNSRHMEGLAVDVSVLNFSFDRFFHYCLQAGFEKVLIYEEKRFLHLQIKRG